MGSLPRRNPNRMTRRSGDATPTPPIPFTAIYRRANHAWAACVCGRQLSSLTRRLCPDGDL
eukprot:7373827-Prymnesium_polylepis.1